MKKQEKNGKDQDKMERERIGRTQGKKGCKAPRINMAFNTENYAYIKTMSKIAGLSMSAFVNLIIERHRIYHSETYQQAQSVIANFPKQDGLPDPQR